MHPLSRTPFFTASKQRPLQVCVPQLPVHAEPSELMLMTTNLHPGSPVAMTHESHMLHPICHFNYFQFHFTIYFLCYKLIYTSKKLLFLDFLVPYAAAYSTHGVVSEYGLTNPNLLPNRSIPPHRLN